MQTRITLWLVVVAAILFVGADRPDETVSGKRALSKLQDYVGSWRGVGQVRRGSTRGAWRESANWAWKFSNDSASLTFKIEDAKFFDTGTLVASGEQGTYDLIVKSQEASLKYSGELNDAGSLVLNAVGAPSSKPARISIRQVADGKRMMMLFERRVGQDSAGQGRYLRMAEVGYTREGSDFGKGTNYVECIVTGGVGTMQVMFAGKTYYVCCGGCRDYFEDDPAGAIAEYARAAATGER